MPDSLYALALIACPLGMGAMMWMMMRQQHGPSSSDGHGNQTELASLQAQIDQLQAKQRDVSRADHTPR